MLGFCDNSEILVTGLRSWCYHSRTTAMWQFILTLFSKKETGPELVVIYDFDERHLAGILANKADESLKEKLNLVDHLCENTF